MKLHKGDQIIVTLGKDKGRKGKIEKVFPDTDAVLVPGVNMYKRHVKSRDSQRPSSIVDISKPLAVSKVALLCPKCHKATRIGYVVSKSDKVRICKKCEQPI